MGVDAVIRVNPGRYVTPAELAKLSWSFCEATGAKNDRRYGNRDALYLRDFSEESSPESPDATISVWIMNRYYGPGYERGTWPTIAGYLEWLRRNFPSGIVYYGGDSSDDLDPVTPEFLDKMWAHWASVGGSPYFGGFNSNKEPGPSCCSGSVVVNGWGGGERFGYCPACSAKWKTVSGAWQQEPFPTR